MSNTLHKGKTETRATDNGLSPKRQTLGEVIDNQYHPAHLLPGCQWGTPAGREATRELQRQRELLPLRKDCGYVPTVR